MPTADGCCRRSSAARCYCSRAPASSSCCAPPLRPLPRNQIRSRLRPRHLLLPRHQVARSGVTGKTSAGHSPLHQAWRRGVGTDSTSSPSRRVRACCTGRTTAIPGIQPMILVLRSWAVLEWWRGDPTGWTPLSAAPTTSSGTRPGAVHGWAITRWADS
jgi:hypothetical protein